MQLQRVSIPDVFCFDDYWSFKIADTEEKCLSFIYWPNYKDIFHSMKADHSNNLNIKKIFKFKIYLVCIHVVSRSISFLLFLTWVSWGCIEFMIFQQCNLKIGKKGKQEIFLNRYWKWLSGSQKNKKIPNFFLVTEREASLLPESEEVIVNKAWLLC